MELPNNGRRCDVDEDLPHRYELALDDLRESQSRNTELQQQLSNARSTATQLPQRPGWLDWEAEKQRILASLEADFDEDDESQQTERLKIVEVLRTTDEVVAAKDRKIQELQQRLEEQDHMGEAKVPDIVLIDQVLNTDAAILEEQERLKQLQEQWREKLLQAEVEIATKRAKIARQCAELAQLRSAESVPPEPPDTTEIEGQAERPNHGRWLARLGLTAADLEPGRHL